VVVTKSTVPVGTGRRIREIVGEARPDLEFDVASNPEFLREGDAIRDFFIETEGISGSQYGDLLMEMNAKLNRLIETEVGEDVVQMLPGGVDAGWVATNAVKDGPGSSFGANIGSTCSRLPAPDALSPATLLPGAPERAGLTARSTRKGGPYCPPFWM